MVFTTIMNFLPSKKNSIFHHCVFTNFSKAPNWGQMLNYVFPITPFFFDVFNEFQLFCHGSVPKLFGYLSFWNVSVIKNRVGYFAFTFGVYVVTHSDRLLTLHVAYQKNFWASLAATVAFLTDIATFLYRSQFIKSSTF